MNNRISLDDSSSLDQVEWPDTVDGRYARDYLEPIMREGTKRYIRNVQTKMLLLRINELVLPVTVNDGEYDNSYVCSPYTHYIRYAKRELELLNRPLLAKGLSAILNVLGFFMKKSHINRVVHVNNWLLSTNLYPEMTGEQLVEIVRLLQKSYPEHAIVARSLCPSLHSEMLAALRAAGCKQVPSRQVYLFRSDVPGFGNAKSRWLLKRDYQLLEKNGYELVSTSDIADSDIPRIAELYAMLYLDKYSHDNPQFDEAFIRLAKQTGILRLYGLRKDGRLDAIMGYFHRNGIMTTPLFGYDTTLPASVGLYRMLSACLIRQAEESGDLLHESAGAAQFKRNRGAVADMEYSAVFDGHLPRGRRWCWTLLEKLLNGIGVPIMRKYKL